MANEVGNKAVEPSPDEPTESYKVITFAAKELPEEYLNVIRAPLLNTLRYGNELFKLIDQQAYYSAYGRYVDVLLSKPKAIVKLAVLQDGVVLGWSLSEPGVLHYVWVKKDVRRQGIGAALMPENLTTFTHVTNYGLSIWAKQKFQHLRFNPFA